NHLKDCFGKKRLAMTVKKCLIYDRLQYNYAHSMLLFNKPIPGAGLRYLFAEAMAIKKSS
ncbi:hypothetical protein JXJ21_22765, partial [candidate division KSB1 bacterium]|nr:hypothetical protein [candidate division KSB1 bacterium]